MFCEPLRILETRASLLLSQLKKKTLAAMRLPLRQWWMLGRILKSDLTQSMLSICRGRKLQQSWLVILMLLGNIQRSNRSRLM
ncbi:MAG: hypothetical protein EB015_21225 [Methylocystaceae bacterium]|nr:hypothetical protein [Methylocystaceae bacterium]